MATDPSVVDRRAFLTQRAAPAVAAVTLTTLGIPVASAQQAGGLRADQAELLKTWMDGNTFLPAKIEDVDPQLRQKYAELKDRIEALPPEVRFAFINMGQRLGGFATAEAQQFFEKNPSAAQLGSEIFIFNGLNNALRFPEGIAHYPLIDANDHTKGTLFEVLNVARAELGLAVPTHANLIETIQGKVQPNGKTIHELLTKVSKWLLNNGYLVSTDHTLPVGNIGTVLLAPKGEVCAVKDGAANCALLVPAAREAEQLVNLLWFGILSQRLVKAKGAGAELSMAGTQFFGGDAVRACFVQSPQFRLARPDYGASGVQQTYRYAGGPLANTTAKILAAWTATIQDPALGPRHPSNTGKVPTCFQALVPSGG